MSEQRQHELAGLVRRLRRFRDVPDAVLTAMIWEHGCCVQRFRDGRTGPPFGELAASGTDPDRALAEWLCAGCPVADQCLELELRTCGAQSFGVFGGLSEVERREVYRLWLADRATTGGDPQGGRP